MAIFHHSTQVIGRSSGRSSVAAAAYRLGVEMVDQRTGVTHDFTRRGGVESWHTLAPANAPEWVNDPARLWNEVEQAEKRKDAQVCREVNIALPKELTPEQMKTLALDYARDQWVQRGMVAQVAFHDLDSQNPHCHVMLTMREIGPEGFGKKNRDWNEHALATEYRQAWAVAANRALEEHGHAARIDHRTLAEQGIEREATQHQGPHAAAMERRGLTPDRKRVMETPPSMDQEAARAELARERKRQQQAREVAEAKAEAEEAQRRADHLRHEHAIRLAEQRSAEAEAKAHEAGAKEQAEAASRSDRRQREAGEEVAKWRKAHPLLWMVWEPARVKQAREQQAEERAAMEQARQHYANHQQRAGEAAREAQTRKAEAAGLMTRCGEADHAAAVARGQVDRVRERHRWDNLTPHQQAQERQRETEALAERQRLRAELEARQRQQAEQWMRGPMPNPNAPGQPLPPPPGPRRGPTGPGRGR